MTHVSSTSGILEAFPTVVNPGPPSRYLGKSSSTFLHTQGGGRLQTAFPRRLCSSCGKPSYGADAVNPSSWVL